jgi:hypothetical protein
MPECRAFGYDDMGDCGRRAYTDSMAVQYLCTQDLDVPDDLRERYTISVREWLNSIESLDHQELGAHEVSPNGALPKSTTAYLHPDESPDLWVGLDPAARELLTMRMAVTYVREDYGGWVPSGLVARTLDAASQTQ